MEGKRRPRLRRWLIALGVLCLLVAAWFSWGVFSEAKFEERLAQLRAEGSLDTFDDLMDAELRAVGEANWEALRASYAELDRLEQESIHHPPPGGLVPEVEDPRIPWSEVERVRAVAFANAVKPLLPTLDKVLGAGSLVFPREKGGDHYGLSPILSWVDALRVMHYTGVRDTPYEHLDRMVRLLALYRPYAAGVYAYYWCTVLFDISLALEKHGADHAPPTRWPPLFAAGEMQILEALVREHREYRVETTEWLAAWVEGQQLDAEPKAFAGKEPYDPGPNGLLQRAYAHDVPGLARGVGRPWFLHEARAALEHLVQRELVAHDVEGMRTQLVEHGWLSWAYAHVPEAIGALRLGRTALGDPDAEGLTDPFAGAPFVLAQRDGALILETSSSKALLAQLRLRGKVERDQDAVPPELLRSLGLRWVVPR